MEVKNTDIGYGLGESLAEDALENGEMIAEFENREVWTLAVGPYQVDMIYDGEDTVIDLSMCKVRE